MSRDEEGSLTFEELVQAGFEALLRRGPDDTGALAYLEALKSGSLSPAGFLADLTASSEFSGLKGRTEGTGDSLVRDLVVALYRYLLCREPEELDFAAQGVGLSDGSTRVGELVLGILSSEEFANKICRNRFIVRPLLLRLWSGDPVAATLNAKLKELLSELIISAGGTTDLATGTEPSDGEVEVGEASIRLALSILGHRDGSRALE